MTLLDKITIIDNIQSNGWTIWGCVLEKWKFAFNILNARWMHIGENQSDLHDWFNCCTICNNDHLIMDLLVSLDVIISPESLQYKILYWLTDNSGLISIIFCSKSHKRSIVALDSSHKEQIETFALVFLLDFLQLSQNRWSCLSPQQTLQTTADVSYTTRWAE